MISRVSSPSKSQPAYLAHPSEIVLRRPLCCDNSTRSAKCGQPNPRHLDLVVRLASADGRGWGSGDTSKMQTLAARFDFEKVDGEEASASGERHLWRALSRRHGHRFAWFLLHLKGGSAVLAAQPFIANLQEPSKVCTLLVPASRDEYRLRSFWSVWVLNRGLWSVRSFWVLNRGLFDEIPYVFGNGNSMLR